ncbi:MAG TPA: GntR family transcriptional regulator [Kiloniellaceae bacterium]
MTALSPVSEHDGGAAQRATPVQERFARIYHALRDRICLLEYPPGSRLSEEEIAQEFEVSRTPVRRVLARLEAEGLVEARHGVGTMVTGVDIENLEQVFQLRMELAVLIGRLSPQPRDKADLARIEALLRRSEALAARVPLDAKAFARLNADFFYELSAMTGNLPLKEISERLYFQTFRIWLQAVPRLNLADEAAVFQREMADVLAALAVGDLEAVGHIRRSHISMSFRRIKAYSQANGKS